MTYTMGVWQTLEELLNFQNTLGVIKEIPGDIAEIGVYQGGSADSITKMLPGREIYLFDTFEGLPDNFHELDPKEYKPGLMKDVDFAGLVEYFSKFPNVHIYKGKFPDTSDPIKDKKFAFVHLDTDIYYSTKDGLEFFYPRMVDGGRIMVHDYPAHRGVKKAADEFLKENNIKSKAIIMGFRQLLIIK